MSWQRMSFADVIEDLTGGNHKFQTNDYLPIGELAIVDQGKGLIAGYVNQKDKKVKASLPVIIFGDHTRVLKYVDFPFALGADGVKVLKPKIEADVKFLYYHLQILNIPETGYNRHFKYLKESDLNIPSLSTQKKIAVILDQADELRKKDHQLLDKYDALLQSIFYDMFGDFVVNDQSLETKKYLLSEIADITSGVAKNTNSIKDDFIEVPYMRVANVQDSHIVLNEVKTIKVSVKDFNKLLLKPNDILLTEGGDPDKLGRGAVWHNEIEPCIHQNHIFRVRVNASIINPIFLSFQIGSKYGKSYFLKAAKQTTGIASINLTQLKKFVVLIPSIALQNKFASIAKNIDEQKQQIKLQLQQSEALFQTLLQKAFAGELTK